jgi:molybdenum cofactor synthesis domain-containing protein
VREDRSGPLVAETLQAGGFEVVERLILPDDKELLEKELKRLCDYRRLDLILTTGGTGFSHRDVTPEATQNVADRAAPGIAEAIRASSMLITPRAMLSRGVSVIRGKTLIVNLPGSPKACAESMDAFMSVIPHGLELLRGQGGDCAVKM